MNILIEMLTIAGGMILGAISITLIFTIFMCSKLYTKIMSKMLNISVKNMCNICDITDDKELK